LLFFLLLSAHFCSNAQIVNIPDANFKNALVNTLCVDINGDYIGDADADINNDGEIQESEAIAVTALSVDNYAIQSLAGIEYFSQLQILSCQFNQLTTLDVQGLSILQSLYCGGNQLVNLNVQGLNNLQHLWCGGNQLVVLDVQGLTNLKQLFCQANELAILNVQGLSNLTSLGCGNNQLTSLDVQGLTDLHGLFCEENLLTALDVQGLSSLVNLTCRNNQLSTLDVQELNSLQYLFCDENQLTVLNVQGLSNLQHLQCVGNQLSTLNLEGLINLTNLHCSYNLLTTLNVQGLNNLINLTCYNNQLTTLDLHNLSNLVNLNCDANQLTTLNLQGLSNLERLECIINQLATLDVQGLSNLKELICGYNSLTTLDLQGLGYLSQLNCPSNQLTALDVHGLSNLTYLFCDNNQLTTLDVQGLNNMISLYCSNNQLTSLFIKNASIESFLDFSSNPDLSYICCDPAQLTAVYNQTLLNGQTDCVVNTSCSYINTFLQGSFINDENFNCENDNLESGREKRIIKAEKAGDEPLYSISSDEGHYEMGLDTGQYMISTYLFNNYSLPCEDSVWVNLPEVNDSAAIDFPLQTFISCPLLEVNIASDRMRRCYDNQYIVQYCNTGTVPAPNAQVTVTLSEDVAFVSSSIPGNNVSGNDWLFSVGEVQPDDCGTFTLIFNVICDSTINGQVICASAHITPDSICTPPNTDWTGAEVMVDGYCEGDSVRFEIRNIGFGDMSQDEQYIVIEDDVILFEGPFNLNSQELLEVKTPANGSSWRLEAGQEPTFPFVSMPYASVEGCGLNLGGLFSLGFVTQFSEQDGNPFYSLECREITGSFDPNDKSAQPEGVGDDHFIYPNTEIEYHINFQNTGTDTAFTVTILDALVQDLDFQTFKAGISSHPYQVELFDQGILKFTFDPIILPDSIVNEPASHGFVRFRITPKSTTPLGTRIENSAGIYFDFNAPVITNTVFHTVDTGFLEHVIVMVNTPTVPDNMRIFPNPVRAGEYLFFENIDIENRITIIDPLGKVVLQTDSAENKILIPKSLPGGVYFFEWIGMNGKKRWGKLVVW
jgi:uncharacterized repeat protein (TIGR01451 family)